MNHEIYSILFSDSNELTGFINIVLPQTAATGNIYIEVKILNE